MGMLSDYVQNKVTDLLYRGQAFPAPATLYFALLKCTHGARSDSTLYALTNTIAILANDGKFHLYKCTTGGTTAASQGALYPGTANEVITDGTAVFTEQTAALDAGTGQVEPSAGGYARVAVTANLTNWSGTQGAGTTAASSGTAGSSSNNGTITFPTVSADYQTASERIWGWATYDASSSGNLLDWGPLSTLQQVLNGQAPPSFAAGQLVKTIGN